MKLPERLNMGIAIISLIVAIISVGIAIYFGFRQTPQKAVQWYIDAQGEFGNIDPTISNLVEIEIRVNGTPVQNIEYMALTFVNTGGIPLVKDDFVEALWLHFGENSQLFSINITNKHPENLDIDYIKVGERTPEKRSDSIEFAPTLINPGESFTIEITGSNLETPKPGGRIVGLSSIPIDTRPKPIETTSRWLSVLVWIAYITTIISITAYVIKRRKDRTKEAEELAERTEELKKTIRELAERRTQTNTQSET